MGRGSIALQVSGLASNPYPRPKENIPMFTTCEVCDRKMPTKDWAGHKNSKKHRLAEDKEKNGFDNANTNSFGANSADFTVDIVGSGSGGETFGNTASGGDAWNSSGNDGWGPSRSFDNNGGTSGYGNNNNNNNNNTTGGGGGDRACYGCGQTGHQKRDCPQGGGGGGDRACYGCGETGHQKRDCPKGGSGGGQACFNCGEVGHRKTECTQPRKPMGGGGSGSDRLCFNCNMPGHNKSDCPEPVNASGGGGAGRECHNCKMVGHISRDCPEPKVFRCRNCDDEGHHSKECPKPKDWSRVKCRNCEEFGHGAGRCPNPPVETDGGDWGNTDGGSGTAISGWADTAKPSGDWADESTAAANGETWGDEAVSTSW